MWLGRVTIGLAHKAVEMGCAASTKHTATAQQQHGQGEPAKTLLDTPSRGAKEVEALLQPAAAPPPAVAAAEQADKEPVKHTTAAVVEAEAPKETPDKHAKLSAVSQPEAVEESRASAVPDAGHHASGHGDLSVTFQEPLPQPVATKICSRSAKRKSTPWHAAGATSSVSADEEDEEEDEEQEVGEKDTAVPAKDITEIEQQPTGCWGFPSLECCQTSVP